jgi:hypothetical protein
MVSMIFTYATKNILNVLLFLPEVFYKCHFIGLVSEVSLTSYFFVLSVVFRHRILQCSTRQLSTLNLPASPSRVLGLQGNYHHTQLWCVFKMYTTLHILESSFNNMLPGSPSHSFYYSHIFYFYQLWLQNIDLLLTITFFKRSHNYKSPVITFSKSFINSFLFYCHS